MKLPNKFKVSGHWYTVCVKDSEWGVANRARGFANPDELTVIIDGSMSESRQVETFLHEVAHTIYHEYNIKQGDDEERTVTQFSSGLHQVLCDNPKILDIFK